MKSITHAHVHTHASVYVHTHVHYPCTSICPQSYTCPLTYTNTHTCLRLTPTSIPIPHTHVHKRNIITPHTHTHLIVETGVVSSGAHQTGTSICRWWVRIQGPVKLWRVHTFLWEIDRVGERVRVSVRIRVGVKFTVRVNTNINTNGTRKQTTIGTYIHKYKRHAQVKKTNSSQITTMNGWHILHNKHDSFLHARQCVDRMCVCVYVCACAHPLIVYCMSDLIMS